jgi:raffinose/stachyose/melibiose transport system permease protein
MRYVTSSLKALVFAVFGFVMLFPLYILVANAFKSQEDIVGSPLTFPNGLSTSYLMDALQAPDFNVVRAYGITAFFAICVNIIGLSVSGPAAYVIARGNKLRYRLVLFFLLTGLFIPSQLIVIPVIYVLKTLGLIGTVPGFLIFESTLTIPITTLLMMTSIQTIPRELDEAAAIDGAGRVRTYLKVIMPLTRPAAATAIILNTIGVWGDFVNPQVIIGPSSEIYTVTTGVYLAISRYSTDYTTVYPNLLLAVTPMLIFFVVMQRRIVSGLTSGAVKG